MNQTTLRIAVSAAAAVALSACGSTDDGRADRLEAERDALEVERDALQQDLEQALTPSWTSTLSSGVHRDRTASTSQHTDATVTMLEFDGSGTFHVTYMVDGDVRTIPFTPDEFNPNVAEQGQFWKNGPPDHGVWDQSRSFTVAPEFRYFNVNGWQVWDYDVGPDGSEMPTEDWRGYVVYGTPTEVLPAGTADYEGRMFANRYSGTDRVPLWGDMTLTADFDNSSIDGMFSDMYIIRSGQENFEKFDGDVLISEGKIEDTGFSARLDGRGEASGVTGSATGQFFGPDAVEVGGVISAEDDVRDFVYEGYFGGEKAQ